MCHLSDIEGVLLENMDNGLAGWFFHPKHLCLLFMYFHFTLACVSYNYFFDIE